MNIQLSEHFTYKKLIRFTIPSIIMIIFTSIYSIVDGIFISNIVGSTAFAAVNIIWPFIAILGAFGFMIGAGGSALVSKTMGEGDNEKANKYFSMLIYFVIFIGIILAILGFVAIQPISKRLGADESTLENCILYGKVLALGLVFFMLQNAFQSFLITAEKPTFGLIVSIISGICNMIGDFLFVYILKLGVLGAGLATIFSQGVGAIIPLIYFISNNKSNLRLRKAKFERRAIIKACTNGSSEMLTNISLSIVSILYNRQLINFIGNDGVVAYGIIMYISYIFSALFIGYSIGTAPIIAYHYGAKNKDELKNLLTKSNIIIGLSGTAMLLLSELSAGILANIFVSYDVGLVELTKRAINIYSISFIFNGFNIFTSSFFTALNNGAVSALISFLRTFLFEVLMVLILPLSFGVDGIWASVIVAEALALIVVIYFVIKNRNRYGYI